jgi:hypothetical protein
VFGSLPRVNLRNLRSLWISGFFRPAICLLIRVGHGSLCPTAHLWLTGLPFRKSEVKMPRGGICHERNGDDEEEHLRESVILRRCSTVEQLVQAPMSGLILSGRLKERDSWQVVRGEQGLVVIPLTGRPG